MRNTIDWPITLDEQIEAIEWALDHEAKVWEKEGKPIGGIRRSALAIIREKLREEKRNETLAPQKEKTHPST